MSAKNRDGQGRWRSLTIAFRVSPEENEDLNMRVRLSGLTKQDYICRRCLERDVVVFANSRVYKALRSEMLQVKEELERIVSVDQIEEHLIDRMKMINTILEGFKAEENRKQSK